MQYVRATRGEFVVRDYGSSWGVVAPNLEVDVGKGADYRGATRCSGGTMLIQHYEPMWADFTTDFRVAGGKMVLEQIALDADGMQVQVTGVVDPARWPEATTGQLEDQLPRMRAIFSPSDTFTLHGEGDFTGTFYLFRAATSSRATSPAPRPASTTTASRTSAARSNGCRIAST